MLLATDCCSLGRQVGLASAEVRAGEGTLRKSMKLSQLLQER